jgi:GT2 family glycosyltransferase
VYWEEADWCWHSKEVGYSSWYEPRSIIYHNFRSALPGKESAFYMYMQTRNSFIFARHYYHGLLRARYFLFYPMYLAYRWLYVLRAGNRVGAKALVRGILDYFRGYRSKERLKEYGYIK